MSEHKNIAPTPARVTSIKLSAANKERIDRYTAIYGATMTFVVNRAIEEWFETVGDVRMEVSTNHSEIKPVVLTTTAVYSEQQQVADELSGGMTLEALSTRKH